MPSYEASCTVGAPPDAVWRLISDVARWPEWLPTVTRVEPLGAAELAPGAQYRIEQPRLRPAIWRVTRLEPPQRFSWASGGPGLQVVGDHELTPAPGGGTAGAAADHLRRAARGAALAAQPLADQPVRGPGGRRARARRRRARLNTNGGPKRDYC